MCRGSEEQPKDKAQNDGPECIFGTFHSHVEQLCKSHATENSQTPFSSRLLQQAPLFQLLNERCAFDSDQFGSLVLDSVRLL